MKPARIVLATLGILFVAQGSIQLFHPKLLTDVVGISADSVTGRIELQVIYGGLHLAFGALCLWGAAKEQNTRPVLTMMLLVSLGAALPRVILALFHQDYSAYSMAAISLEVLCVLLLFWLLRRTRPPMTT